MIKAGCLFCQHNQKPRSKKRGQPCSWHQDSGSTQSQPRANSEPSRSKPISLRVASKNPPRVYSDSLDDVDVEKFR